MNHSWNNIGVITSKQKLRKIRDRKRGFFVVDNIVIDKIARHCTPYCVSVYLSLCRHADIDKQTCFPSETLIAGENNIGTTTVKNSIKRLEELGLISVFRSRRANGTRNVNFYTLLYILKWEYQPEALSTIDTINEPPETSNYRSHSRETSNKETNNIKETQDKEVLFKEEEESDFIKALRANRLNGRTNFELPAEPQNNLPDDIRVDKNYAPIR